MTATTSRPLHYSMATAAELLSDYLDRPIRRRDLFDWLIEHDWATHTLTGHVPTAAALAADVLTVVPAQLPTGRVWDQLVLTPTGFDRLRTALAAATPLLLDIPTEHQ